MQPAGRRFPADVVVLRQEDEEVAAVRRNAGHGVRPASHGDAVVVARRHVVARVPLHVDAENMVSIPGDRSLFTE